MRRDVSPVADNGRVSLYRDEAVVLRTQKLGEADRIVTLLTRGHGRIRAVAKGVRRTTSRFGARLEPFMHIDVQLATGRSLDIVTQVETVAPFGTKICADYARYTSATAILETAERLSAEEREPALQHYLLLVGALRALAGGAHDPGLVLDAFLLRGLAIAGFAPSFTDCARCSTQGPHRLFSVHSGGMVCGACRPAGTVAPSADTLALLSALLTGDWAVADQSEEQARREASGITAAFLQWHLERGLRSLPLVERVYRERQVIGDDEPVAHL
nr:DNA repair protein RecO [Phytoactinopolyspora alkaliphila]